MAHRKADCKIEDTMIFKMSSGVFSNESVPCLLGAGYVELEDVDKPTLERYKKNRHFASGGNYGQIKEIMDDTHNVDGSAAYGLWQ